MLVDFDELAFWLKPPAGALDEPHLEPLPVEQGLGEAPAEGLGEEEGEHAGQEGRHPEEHGGVVAQQQHVGGQDGAQSAHHHREPHPHPAHHRGEQLGRVQVEDGVGAVGGEPAEHGEGDPGGGHVGGEQGVRGQAGARHKQEEAHGPLPPKHGPLQGEDDVDVAGQLDGGGDEKAEVEVLGQLGLVEEQHVVEGGAGDPAAQQDRCLGPEDGEPEEVGGRVGPGLLLPWS